MNSAKTIYCPKCGKKIATYDGKGSIDIVTKCRKCNKLEIYRINDDEVEIKPLPQRNTSSGCTIY